MIERSDRAYSYRDHRAGVGPSGDRLGPPLVIGSNWSVHPMPGQQALNLNHAGYREGNTSYPRREA
jgi:hypothetical protein